MPLNRRAFLKGTLATSVLQPFLHGQQGRPRVGLQLYTVRTETAKDLAATIRTVAEIGYAEIEFGTTQPANRMKQIMDDVGLSCPSIHVVANALRTTPESQIQYAIDVGARCMVNTAPPPEYKTVDDYKEWSEVLNRSGEQSKRAGIGSSME